MQTKEYPFYLCYYQHEDLFTISGDATTLSRGFRIRQIARHRGSPNFHRRAQPASQVANEGVVARGQVLIRLARMASDATENSAGARPCVFFLSDPITPDPALHRRRATTCHWGFTSTSTARHLTL